MQPTNKCSVFQRCPLLLFETVHILYSNQPAVFSTPLISGWQSHILVRLWSHSLPHKPPALSANQTPLPRPHSHPLHLQTVLHLSGSCHFHPLNLFMLKCE